MKGVGKFTACGAPAYVSSLAQYSPEEPRQKIHTWAPPPGEKQKKWIMLSNVLACLGVAQGTCFCLTWLEALSLEATGNRGEQDTELWFFRQMTGENKRWKSFKRSRNFQPVRLMKPVDKYWDRWCFFFQIPNS